MTELFTDRLRFARCDAADTGQAFRFVRHDLKCFLTKTVGNLARELRADAFDNTGGQIVRNALDGSRHAAFKIFRLELLAIGGMGDPVPGQHQFLAEADLRQCADRRHLLAVVCDHADDGVSVVFILINHRIHRAADALQLVVHSPVLRQNFCPPIIARNTQKVPPG